jgi:hypothetical protein
LSRTGFRGADAHATTIDATAIIASVGSLRRMVTIAA